MQDFKNFDRQRLELLEKRIKGIYGTGGNQQTPIVISDDEHEHNEHGGAGLGIPAGLMTGAGVAGGGGATTQRDSNDSIDTSSSHPEDHEQLKVN